MAHVVDRTRTCTAADGKARAACAPDPPAENGHAGARGWLAAVDSAFAVHQLVEHHAVHSPGRIAVSTDLERLTYADLDRRGNQLAHHLQALGVGPETLVGLCLDRSPQMVVGILGILKAGGAYVPLDPGYPADRIAHVLSDSRAPLVVTREGLTDRLSGHQGRLVRVDADAASIARRPTYQAKAGIKPDNLAYVIYTSGSTGRPKGVMVGHGNLLRSTRARFAFYREPVSAFVLLSSYAFDSSVAGIFWTLCQGGNLVLPPDNALQDLLELIRLCGRHRVSHLLCVPSLWAAVLEQAEPGQLAGLRTAVVAGETCTRGLVERHRQRLRHVALVNEYGPTEATVWCTAHDCSADEADGPVPIGREIEGAQVRLLDGGLRAAAAGTAAELYVGGDGITRGYLGRPDLTAEKFVPDPFGPPGSRLYRTGDLARRRAGGEIEFIGRVDHQVKVRGYRIELGEIEAVLGRHPAVREVAVRAREDQPGDVRLVAYVVERGARSAGPEALKAFLRDKLPDYMVPSAFVALSALPVGPNGKVDRNALPAPAREARSDRPEYVAPRDETELQLARIWEQVLGIQPVGMRDNIFELGVHSLTAARLFARVEKAFGKRLPPGPLFQAPTIEQLAALLRGGTPANRWTSLVPIQPRGSRPPLFCVHGGAGTILLFHGLARRLGADQPLYGLQQRGLYGKAAPQTRVEQMAEHYIEEIKTVQPRGPYYLGGFCFGGCVAYEMAARLQARGEEVAFLVLFNSVSPRYTHRRMRERAEAEAASDALLLKQRPERRPGNKLVALLQRARDGVGWRVRRLRIPLRLRKLRYQFYVKLGRPVPETIRDVFFLDNNMWAELSYDPPAWPGKVHLFRAQGLYKEPLLGWDGLAGGGIEVCEISGDHPDQRIILQEPHVRQVAARLDQWLAGCRPERADGEPAGSCR